MLGVYNRVQMKKLLLFSAGGLILLVVAVWLLSFAETSTPADSRLARGRSLLDSENYLGALEALRLLPEAQQGKADTHTLLGTAYLRLHLYLAAIKEFENAERKGSRRPDPWIGLASSYIELGDGQKALDEATHATTVDPKSVDAWIMLGRAYWLQRNFAEAEKMALKAQAIEPNHPVIGELLLHIHFDQDQADKFQTAFDRIKDPSRGVQDLAVQFFVRQGQWLKAYESRTRFERNAVQHAIFETELALKREPGRMDLYPGLIRNLVKDARIEDAIAAASRYKGPVPVDLEIGKAYWMLGRKDAAIPYFERASAGKVHKLSAEVALATITGDLRHWREAYRAERIENDHFILGKLEMALQTASPMFRAFAYRYAGIYDAFFYSKAVEQATKVLGDEPRDLDALLTIGTAYHRLGKVSDAVRYMEQTVEFYPREAEGFARLASLAIDGKDATKTLAYMTKAVDLEPGNPGILYNLAWMMDQMGDIPKAIDLYERAIRASPITFEAMNNLALIYEQNGQSVRAMELLQRAILVDPEIEIGYFNLGSHYVRQREWKLALQTFDRVLELNPGSSPAAVEKGRIHVEIGESQAALDDLNRGLEVDPHSFDAYYLLSLAYEKLNHPKEAIAAAEEAERIRANTPEIKAALDRLRAIEGKDK